jgi:hypothetical protein
MPNDYDDTLYCPRCGSADTHIESDFIPNRYGAGEGLCFYCGVTFGFTFELQPALKEEQQR